MHVANVETADAPSLRPSRLRVWLVETYYTGSHRAWADGYARASRHHIDLLTMTGAFWKWRLLGGAIELARQAHARWQQGQRPDVILATDMVNLPTWLGLVRPLLADTPIVLYCHENQLTYPLPPGFKRDLTYGVINWLSMLAADRVCFNSQFHRDQFFDELPRLLKHYPDYNHLDLIDAVRARSQVLPVGCDLRGLAVDRQAARADRPPIVLWNQRWEYDKNPTEFFAVLQRLADEGVDFGVAVAGENLRQTPSEFIEARERLGERVVHWGYVEGRAAYGRLLAAADVVVSTAWHEFFGVATVEAIFCGCLPLLPNRLSYPELIPAAWHDLCLYADSDDLVARLRRALTERQPAPPELRQAMARFDWEALAPIYDDLLEEVARAGRRSPLTA